MAISSKASVGGAGKKTKKQWKTVRDGKYQMEIVDITDSTRNNMNTGEPEDIYVVDYVVLSGDRKNVPLYDWQISEDEDSPNMYGRRVRQYVTAKLSPAITFEQDGKTINGKESTLYGIVKAALHAGEELTEAELDFYRNDARNLGALVGAQVLNTVDEKRNSAGLLSNRIIKTSPIRRKLPEYAQPVWDRPQQQIDDSNPAILFEDTGEQVYGYYRDGGLGEFVTQSEVVRYSKEQCDGRILSWKGIQDYKAAKASKASLVGNIVVNEEDIPF